MESTDLVPMDNDKPRIQRRAEEFRDLPESLQRNLQTFLTLTMDTLAALHQKVKSSMIPDATKQRVSIEVVPSLYISDQYDQTLDTLRTKSRSIMVFAGILKYRMSPDVYSYLARLDVEIAL